MAGGVVIGGRVYPLLHPVTGHLIPVFGPADHGIEFRAGDGHNKRRTEDITLGVHHWSGSENSVETLANTLRKRKLGVEFAISPYGSLYQFCDPLEVDTADAGIANSRSWGVEIVNAGIRRASTLWREPRHRKPNLGPRTAYDAVLHGKKVRCWDFYPAQTSTALALNAVMHEAIPTYPATVHTGWETLPIKGVNAVKGAIGHYHVTRHKLDPGPRLMAQLEEFMRTGKVPLELASQCLLDREQGGRS